MPKVNLDVVINDREGRPIKAKAGSDRDATVKDMLLQAIDQQVEADLHMKPSDRLMLYKIGEKIDADDGEGVEFTSDETSLLVSRMDTLAFLPLVYGQVLRVIDPARLK